MPRAGWNIIESEGMKFKFKNDHGAVAVNKKITLKEGENLMTHYLYHSRGRIVSNEYKDRAFMDYYAVLRKKNRWCISSYYRGWQ